MSNKKSEKRFLEETVDIDGVQVPLRVELDFNHQNGQLSITSRIKTKLVSRNSDIQKAVVQNIGAKTLELMAEGIRMRDTWLSENPEETGPTLFDNEEEGEGGPDDEGQAEPVKLGMSAKGAKRKVDF